MVVLILRFSLSLSLCYQQEYFAVTAVFFSIQKSLHRDKNNKDDFFFSRKMVISLNIIK